MTTRFHKLNISDKTKKDIINLKDEFYCDAINLIIEQENIDIDSNEDLLECCYITLFDIIENKRRKVVIIMRQVKHNFKVLSKQVCRNCGRPLKLNVILRKHNPPRLCYKCYMEIRLHNKNKKSYRRNIECGNGNV